MLFYESLTVYQKAFVVNKQVYQLLKQNNSIPPYLKNQLGRASLSVMLNIAEGTAKTSARDRKNFYTIARGSAFESASLIRFLASENEITNEMEERIYGFFEEISRMLFVMIGNLGKKI